MSFVNNKTRFEPGDTPTASELNTPYDSLASTSANIDGDNSATGWITHRHISAASAFANALYEYENPTTTETTYSNTSYATITQGGNPAQITLNFTPEVGQLVRFSASGIVGANEVASDYDYAGLPGGNKGKDNYYAFRLLLNHTTSGVSGTTVLGEWGYSFTTKKSGTLQDARGPVISSGINWQTFQFSTVYRHTNALRLLNSVVLQCKVFKNTNVLHVERHQLYAIHAKR